MQLIKRLTQTLSAGSTSLTFTDSMINNNSIIEVYADNIGVYPTALSQSGTSVTVQFDEQQVAHSILLLINNIVSLSDPTLATLLDVDLSTLSDDDILTYDETAEKWVNAGARTAEDIAYDNTDSGLTATDVQGAIDELAQSGGGLPDFKNAGYHNSIYRGNFLGTEITSNQWDAISSGEFTNLYIGDYWTIDGVNWRIADFDYWLNTGETDYVCDKHHIVIVPDTPLYKARMNSSATSSGGYLSSEMYSSNLNNAKTTINGLFTDHVLSYSDRLVNATSSGTPNGFTPTTCSIELMSETQLFGFRCWSGSANGFDIGVSNRQFSLFRLAGPMIHLQNPYWLRSVASASSFTLVNAQGFPYRIDANTSHGVRPCFALYVQEV